MSTRTRLAGVIAAAAALTMTLAACDSGTDAAPPSTGAPAAGDESSVPAFALLTADISDFGQVQIEGIESVVEPLGGSLTIFDGFNDPTQQNGACMDVITSGQYNGIILNAISGAGAVPCVDAAREAGIPVAGLESVIGPDELNVEPQVEGVIISAASSFQLVGEATVDLLEQACEGLDPCRYIQVVGSQAYSLEAIRIQVLDEMLEGSNITRVALGEDGYNPERGRQVVSELLTANADVDVILISSDSSAVQVVDLLEELGRDDILVAGDGASRQGVAAINEGTMFGTVRLAPFTFGELAAQGLVAHLNGEEVMSPAEVAELTTPVALTSDNIEGIEGQWG